MSYVRARTSQAEVDGAVDTDLENHVNGEGAQQASDVLSFDLTVHIEDGSAVDYRIDDENTIVYFGDVGTTAILRFADQALLTLSKVVNEAVSAVLSALKVPARSDSRPKADPGSGESVIWIDTDVTVSDACPMRFDTDGEWTHIMLAETQTLCLTFRSEGLLQFALQVGRAIREMMHVRGVPTMQ